MADVADMTDLGCPSGYVHFLIVGYVGYVVDGVFMVGIQFTAIQILRGCLGCHLGAYLGYPR